MVLSVLNMKCCVFALVMACACMADILVIFVQTTKCHNIPFDFPPVQHWMSTLEIVQIA